MHTVNSGNFEVGAGNSAVLRMAQAELLLFILDGIHYNLCDLIFQASSRRQSPLLSITFLYQ